MEKWMTDLPVEIKQKPLYQLCIPGSHDSGSSNLNVDKPVAHDQNYWKILRQISRFRVIKTLIRNWSETQSLPIKKQLEIGIRYFDIRLELAAPLEEASFDEMYTVHALYGEKASLFLQEIKEFLDRHREEVVIVDINHVYQMSQVDFIHYFARPMQDLFGRDSFCPVMVDIADATIEELVETNHRLIVVGPYETNILGIIYASQRMINEWPNKNKIYDLIAFMRDKVNEPSSASLHVLQGVMTAKFCDIIKNIFGSLRDDFGYSSRRVTTDFVNSLNFKEKQNVNIVMTDEVDENFCRSVVNLNTMLPNEL